MLTLPFDAVYGSAVCMVNWVVGSSGKSCIALWPVDIQLSFQYLMDGCVVIIMLSCRIPTVLWYVGAIPHSSLSDNNSFLSSQFLTQLQPKETLFWIHFSMCKLLLFQTYFLLFCILCCLLLRIQSIAQKRTSEWFLQWLWDGFVILGSMATL